MRFLKSQKKKKILYTTRGSPFLFLFYLKTLSFDLAIIEEAQHATNPAYNL